MSHTRRQRHKTQQKKSRHCVSLGTQSKGQIPSDTNTDISGVGEGGQEGVVKPAGVSNGMQENCPRWKLQHFFTQLLMAHNCSHTGATIETQSLAAGLLLFFKSLQVQVLVSWLLAGSKTKDSRELSNAAEDNSFEPIHFLPIQICYLEPR